MTPFTRAAWSAPSSTIRPRLVLMKKAVGFRNIVVHNYQEIDWAIVFNLCYHKLDDFRAFAQAIVHLA